MSDRIEKKKAKSRSRRNAIRLADRIKRSGFNMSPCSRCRSDEQECKMAPGSLKCSYCTKLGRSCDVFGPSETEYDKLSAEEDRLELQERSTEEDLLRAQQRFNELQQHFNEQQQHLNELFGRLARLRSQKKLLRKRGIEMIRRGVSGVEAMEEYERLEEEQRRLESEVATSAQAAGAVSWPSLEGADWSPGNIDWGALLPTGSVAAGESSLTGVGHRQGS